MSSFVAALMVDPVSKLLLLFDDEDLFGAFDEFFGFVFDVAFEIVKSNKSSSSS